MDKRIPHDVAAESYAYWRSVGLDHLTACAWLGNEDGETSFRLGVIGDHGTAFGPAQHHQARIDTIKQPPPKGCGIDIKTASHADQLKAIHWEVTEGAYRHVLPAVIAAPTMAAKIAVLVSRYEQSAQQDRDIRRRAALGNYWAGEFADHDAIDGCACGIEHDGHTADHELLAPRGQA